MLKEFLKSLTEPGGQLLQRRDPQFPTGARPVAMLLQKEDNCPKHPGKLTHMSGPSQDSLLSYTNGSKIALYHKPFQENKELSFYTQKLEGTLTQYLNSVVASFHS